MAQQLSSIGSLFKKTKNDPEFVATQERVRQSLLKMLSRAIKEVQLVFTESGEGGRVGDCRATQRLCTRFENVLRHGQKARWFGQNSSFWPLVLQISRKQAIEYINGLQYAVTGIGKCRAWIRMAVNESSLESYIGVICQDSSLKSQHYEGHAFMRDEDVVQPLQQLLGGLSQINFNITVDTASLEFEAVPEALQPPLQLRLPQHMIDNRERRRHRRHRHKPASRSHDHQVTTHDRQVTPIEDTSDDSSSDGQSSDQEEEDEREGDGEREGGRVEDEIIGRRDIIETSKKFGFGEVTNYQDTVQDNIQDIVQDTIQDIVQDNIQDNIQDTIQDNIQDNIQDTSHNIDENASQDRIWKTDDFNIVSERISTNPFDQLEQDSPPHETTDHLHDVPYVTQEKSMYSGRNPFDDLPPHSLPPSPSHPPPPVYDDDDFTTPTADNIRTPDFPPPTLNLSHPHTTTTTTTTDIAPAPATPSPPDSSTSSDFLSEYVPMSSCRQQPSSEMMTGDGVGRRVTRTDSLEWSMYIEQNMADGVDDSSPTLQLEEDYYSAEMGIPELQQAIQHLKRDISAASSSPSEQHRLRKKIIQLQLKLQNKKEDEESLSPHEEICGHKFVRQPRQGKVLRDLTCLSCKKKVRGLIREWYRCKTCQSVCHKKCLSSVVNQCSVPGEDVQYIMEVCPDVGITAQQFRCVRCNRGFTLSSTVVRQCDYDGLYYCSDCHTNDMTIIPARVMHNWDFNTRTVCCQCSSLLHHLSSRPLLSVQRVNSLLYIHIQDLVVVESLRKDLLYMKEYLADCKIAKDLQLLHKLDIFPNFKEHAYLFSLHEMVEIQNGTLLPLLKDIHRSFAQHIKRDCQVCSKKSHVCTLCSSDEPLYPFGHDVSICLHCSATYHKNCFSEVSSCPKCHRIKTT